MVVPAMIVEEGTIEKMAKLLHLVKKEFRPLSFRYIEETSMSDSSFVWV